MPRNRYKTPCRVPGCKAWAMRGRTRCRAHLDPELGPRGGGAPPANLNALKTGAHAQPLPPSDLRDLARQLVRRPDQLPDLLLPVIQSLHARTRDPYKTLLALRTLLADLLPRVAVHLAPLDASVLLRCLPPEQRAPVLHEIQKQAALRGSLSPLPPLDGIDIEPRKNTETSTGTPFTSSCE